MKKRLKYIVSALIVLLSLIMFSSSTMHASGLTFDVNPVGKDHEKLGYFKLNAKSGSDILLPIKIENISDSKISIKVKFLNALTSSYGNIQYIDKEKIGNSLLLDSKYGMAQYIKGPDVIELEKGEIKTVNYSINIPSNVTEGTLLGGLSFKNTSNENKDDSENGIKINNEIERVVGIQLDLGKKENSNIQLEDDIQLVEDSSPPFLNIGLVNNNPVIVEGVSIKYKVFEGDKERFEGETIPFKMAPKTKIALPIDWKGKFESGNYNVKITLDVNGKKVNRNYSLKIKEKDVKSNENIVDITNEGTGKSSGYSNVIISTLFGFLIGIGCFWFIIICKRKKSEKSESESQSQ